MAGTAWYDVITLATSKGGAGKSTLARGLAAHWFALGRKPVLIDADPTATLSKRYNPQGKLGGVPVVAEPEELVTQVIEELRAQHTPVIVDTAGFRNRTSRRRAGVQRDAKQRYLYSKELQRDQRGPHGFGSTDGGRTTHQRLERQAVIHSPAVGLPDHSQ